LWNVVERRSLSLVQQQRRGSAVKDPVVQPKISLKNDGRRRSQSVVSIAKNVAISIFSPPTVLTQFSRISRKFEVYKMGIC
jgi:hypothetical protein